MERPLLLDESNMTVNHMKQEFHLNNIKNSVPIHQKMLGWLANGELERILETTSVA
jgi:hypothetical protein